MNDSLGCTRQQSTFSRLCALSYITALIYMDIKFRSVFLGHQLDSLLNDMIDELTSNNNKDNCDLMLPSLRRTLAAMTDESISEILHKGSPSVEDDSDALPASLLFNALKFASHHLPPKLSLTC
jgi:hypothetical protein